mmetsp:Transcript_16740/g.39837  ORF Transcript_16740/g.39837 Transcript_16740/m.39837 type:complete len:296 (+) Transcript_16740:20-907(+)
MAATPKSSELALGLRSARKYVAVNGGVLIIAWLVTSLDWVVHSCTASTLASAALGTAALYALVYYACTAKLHGRRRIFAQSRLPAIPLMALIWHPLGTMLERMLHGNGSHAPSAVAAVSELLPGWLLPRAFNWYGGLVLRLLAFELTYDFLFYWAHRMAHAHPLVYRLVHKLHHAHTHDVRLLSALQMGPLDVLLTHTLPVLGALAIIPLAPGFEYNVGKTYLLFQEFYGHAGVENRGRNFGPAPWLARALDVELRSADHQRHHIRADVNFSKRFSLWDRLFCTWSAAEIGGKQH